MFERAETTVAVSAARRAGAARVVVAAAALALVASCVAMAERASPLTVNFCESDEACVASGGACDAELGACIDPALLEHGVILQVTDPESAISTEHFLVVSEANAAEPTVVAVPGNVVVRGLVNDVRDDATPIPASLTFTRIPDRPGLSAEPIYVDSDTTDYSDGERDQSNNFQVSVPPGAYEVEVEPNVVAPPDGPLPPLYHPFRRQVIIEPSEEQDAAYVDFSYSHDTRVVQGVVTDDHGDALGGIRVFARDPEGGERVSNVSVTECSPADEERCGLFELVLPPEVNAFRLRIQGTEAGQLLPVVDRAGYAFDVLDRDPEDGVLSPEELQPVRFPAMGEPVLVVPEVLGEDRAGHRDLLAGATVVFRTDEIGDPASPVGSLEARASTDEDGLAHGEGAAAYPFGAGIKLPPATYTVSITPPPESGYATAEQEVIVAPGEDPEAPIELALHVGPLQHVAGAVTMADGTAVPQVRVEATGEGGDIFAATGGDDGSFVLAVDPGRYDLIFVTPEQSGLPWVPVLGVAVFGDVEETVTSHFGTPVRGLVVRGAAREPVVGAAVDAFVEFPVDEGQTRIIRVGRASTTADGRFTILVPRMELEAIP